MLKLLDKIYVNISNWAVYGSIWNTKNYKKRHSIRRLVANLYSIREFIANLYRVPYNKYLCKRFPWLIPYNRFSGHKITDKSKGYWPGSPDSIPNYKWDYTELEGLEKGWRIAFGIDLCKEIQHELEKNNAVEKYCVTQIKEKFGRMRWYSGYVGDIDKIITKYSDLSERTCIKCGKPAEVYSTWWISPFCKKCASNMKHEKFVSYCEYWKHSPYSCEGLEDESDEKES